MASQVGGLTIIGPGTAPSTPGLGGFSFLLLAPPLSPPSLSSRAHARMRLARSPLSFSTHRLQAAGVNVTAIADLAACNFTSAATVPPCLAERVTALLAANATANVTASDGELGVCPGLGASGHRAIPHRCCSGFVLRRALLPAQRQQPALGNARLQLSGVPSTAPVIMQSPLMIAAPPAPCRRPPPTPSPVAAAPLRVATVTAGPNGPIVTLAGQLNDGKHSEPLLGPAQSPPGKTASHLCSPLLTT
jgi:hypothetical protein